MTGLRWQAGFLAFLSFLALAGFASGASIDAVSADLHSNPCDIEERGTVAYLLYPSGLVVLDITDPLRPEAFSTTFLPGERGDLLQTAGYLYVARGSGGLFTMDLSEPSRPEIVDTLAAPSSFTRMDAGAGRLYVADRDSGLVVLDLGTPEAPARLLTFPMGAPILDLRIRSAMLYLAVERSGIRIYDISHFTPAFITTLTELREAEHLDISFSTLYVSSGVDGIAAVDISDTLNPVLMSDVYDPDSATGDLAVVDTFLVTVYAGRELQLLRRGRIAEGPLAVSEPDTTLAGVIPLDGRLFTTSLDEGLRIVNLIIPANATYVSRIDLPHVTTQDVTVEGDTAFVAAGTRGISFVSLRDELEPESLAVLHAAGSVSAVEARNGLLYSVEGSEGLHIYDISSRLPVGSLSLRGKPQGIVLKGNFAYVAADTAGLLVVDVSIPSSPILVDSIETGGAAGRRAKSAEISGNLLAVAEGDGVRIADITSGAHPVLLGSFPTADEANDVAFSGGAELYVALQRTGLLTLDIGDPTRPDSIGMASIPVPVAFRDVEKLGGVLYLTESRGPFVNGFIHVISLSNPRAPRQVILLESQGAPGRVATGPERAYVTAGFGGVEIYGTFEDYGFLRIGDYDPYAPIDAVAASETRAVAADRDGKLWPFTVQEGGVLGRGEPYDVGSQMADVVVDGQRVFASVVGESLLVELRMPTPDRLLLTRVIPLPAEGAGLAVRDSLLFVAMTTKGLGIYNIASSDTVGPLGFFEEGVNPGTDLAAAEALKVAVDGTIAYVSTATGSSGLFLLDVSEPTAPAFRSIAGTNGHRVLALAATDGYVYVCVRVDGVLIVNATNPSAPSRVGLDRQDMNFSRRLQAEGDFLFAARRDQGICAYDITNLGDPVRVRQERTPETASDLAVFGPYIAEADGSAFRLYKQDIVNADQAAPRYAIGILSDPFANAFVDIVVVASEALVDKPEIRIVMGDVDSTLFVSRLDTPHNVYRSTYRLSQIGGAEVHVAGEDLAGNKSDTFKTFSVSYVRGSKGGSIYTPSGKVEVRVPARASAGDSYVLLSPVDREELGEEAAPPPTTIAGPFRLALGGSEGEVVVRARDLVPDAEGRTPVLYRKEGSGWTACATSYDGAARLAESTLPGSAVFLFAPGEGSPPAAPVLRLEPNRPNPFNPQTAIVFRLGGEARVRLSIHDIAGRRVRALEDRALPSGRHEVVWDGRDDRGRPAGSGVYFVRIEAVGLALDRKMILLR